MNTVYVEKLEAVGPAQIIFMAAMSKNWDITAVDHFPVKTGEDRVLIPAGDFVLCQDGLVLQSRGLLLGDSSSPQALAKIDPRGRFLKAFSLRHAHPALPCPVRALYELIECGLPGINLAVALTREVYADKSELMFDPFWTVSDLPEVKDNLSIANYALLLILKGAVLAHNN